jgi:YD repeat-containing protein
MGNYRDQPVPADYDGDGKADFAIWRPTTGVWYIRKSSDSNYEMYTLGSPGDTAVPSAYLKQVGGEVTGDALNAARLAPSNATGGTNLHSQNFGWGTSLVNLPGRAGLDANLGISYNSLLWTKVGSAMVFDADNSNVTPGFRLGLPTIEPIYYDTDQGKNVWAYMMVTPSGSRVQFRQTAVTNVYETADSTYTQLIANSPQGPITPNENLWILVRTTDGTQMTYSWSLGAYRCTQIKDRNGNYITVEYNGEGQLWKITDTLGRVITIAYDGATGLPSTINFPRYGGNGTDTTAVTQPWVAFSYTDVTVNTTFHSSLTIVGPPNGTVIKVLDKIAYADGSSTRFSYNGFAQVSKVETYAPNSGFLNHVAISYEQTPTSEILTSPLEVPRLRQTQIKVKDFNSDNPVTVKNELRSGNVTDIDGGTVSAKLVQVWMENHPTGNITNTYVGASGWMEGLPIRVDDWANGTGGLELKRSSFTKWTHDRIDESTVQYPVNPRVTNSRVSDGVNNKDTLVQYEMVGTGSTIAMFGLVKKVEIGNGTTVYKTIDTTYQLDPAYVSRRIIGLPLEVKTSGYNDLTTSDEDASDVTYVYDGENFSLETNQIVTPTQHDSSYGSSFVVGRGNLTSTTRHDVSSATPDSTSKIRYDIAGSPVAQIDPSNRKTKIAYADNFNTTPSASTFAYPTTLTDPAGFSSTVQYRFDLGANIEANSPAPVGNLYGKRTTRTFDEKGRVVKDSIWKYTGSSWVENSYQRFDYTPTDGIKHQVFSTIADTNSNNAADIADEVLTESWTDGAGRVRLSRTPHTWDTNGTLTWSGTETKYDVLGRTASQSVPTDVNSSWQPTGDDLTRGYLWTHQEYDWMSRVIRKVNTDGSLTSSNPSDVIISYSVCGCAGGLQTTIQGEEIIEKSWDGTTSTSLGRRKQKLYQDVMGRTWKSEVFNWDGSVYSTTQTKFNGRDQATQVTVTEASTSVSQVTTMSYDGHGRLETRHIPRQNASSVTTFHYNPDDSVSSAVDARNVTVNYNYNSRGLLENVSYAPQTGSTVPATHDIEFGYDNAGNRTSMLDGLGSVSYEYNSLSQVTAESRDFTDNLSGVPNGVFRLEYSYALNGQLNSLKDPYGQEINYGHDKLGRLSTVTGSSFGGVTSYASNAHYRAWGGLQSLSYSNGTTMSLTFNNRLQADHYQLVKNGTETLLTKDYSFYADGQLRKLDDQLDDKFDRSNTYDQLGRPATAKTGLEARGGTATGSQLNDLPYRQSFVYNAFGNLKERGGLRWGEPPLGNFNYNYSNDRVTHPGWLYDADGRELSGGEGYDSLLSTYDAAGQLVVMTRERPGGSINETNRYFDGNGREGKRQERSYQETSPDNWEWYSAPPTYYIRSAVLGGEVVSDADNGGGKVRTYVRANGAELAWQNGVASSPAANVSFQHYDAAGLSYRTTDSSGSVYTQGGYEGSAAEMDPMGGNVGTANPNVPYDPGTYCVGCGIESENMTMFVNGQNVGFTLDGIPISRNRFQSIVEGRQFDILMIQALPRFAGYSLRFGNGDEQWAGTDLEGAIGQMEGGEGLTRNWYVSDQSWFFTGPTTSWRQYFTVVEAEKNGKALHFKDTQSAKDFLTSVLDNGDCRNKLAQLVKKLAEITGTGAIDENLDQVFDKIASQNKGGFTFNVRQSVNLFDLMADKVEADFPKYKMHRGQAGQLFPMGATYRADHTGNLAYVLLQEKAFDPAYGVGSDRGAANALMIHLVHELVHAASKTGTYDHDNDKRLLDAVVSMGAASVNIYIEKHCSVPPDPRRPSRGRK